MAADQFWDLLYDLADRGATLFVTTHYMDEAAYCNRLAFIYRGRLIADGSPANLRAEHGQNHIYNIDDADVDGILPWLEGRDEIDAYLSGASLHAVLAPDSVTTAADLRHQLVSAGFADARVTEVKPTIEDVFVSLVTEGERRSQQRS